MALTEKVDDMLEKLQLLYKHSRVVQSELDQVKNKVGLLGKT